MIKTEDLLIEIGTEELPPRDLEKLSQSFANSLAQQITAAGLHYADQRIFATPRRLAVMFLSLDTEQPLQTVEKRGPALSAAYDQNGAPTPAALGFAKSCGIEFAQLSKLETEKGSWLYFTQQITGKNSAELLPGFVQTALAQLPIKKNMRWGDGRYSFVRPVHWIILLQGERVIPAEFFGISSGNITHGHRILCATPLTVKHPREYEALLAKQGFVIADFTQRKELIRAQVQKLAQDADGIAILHEELLNTVCGLVEWPVALLANFAPEFLKVPQECLISAMQDHQKCFAVADTHGKLMAKFILVSNLRSADPNIIVHGNELVMHARLADASFYYAKDQKRSLASRVDGLRNVVYQKQLGTVYDKTLRVQQLAVQIAKQINGDAALVERAAYLSKADLLTSMVYEFPELQGTMGYYYAQHDGEDSAVAHALYEQYKPKHAQDELPQGVVGTCVALAERIDSLVGLFGIGSIPTGDKDPFALRRQALAIMRILIEQELRLNLQELLLASYKLYNAMFADPTAQLLEFCFERLKAWCINDVITSKIFAAVSAVNNAVPVDFYQRLLAVAAFQQLPAAQSLAAANKRVHNLLEKTNAASANHVNVALLQDQYEKSLYHAILDKSREIEPLLQTLDYTGVLQSLASLQLVVDEFFNNVLVMTDDLDVRHNRLCLLQQLRSLFLQIADISML